MQTERGRGLTMNGTPEKARMGRCAMVVRAPTEVPAKRSSGGWGPDFARDRIVLKILHEMRRGIRIRIAEAWREDKGQDSSECTPDF